MSQTKAPRKRKTAAEKRAEVAAAAEAMAEAQRAADETLWERRMQALSLRNAGMVFSDIAKVQKTSVATARADVEHAKREVMASSLEDIIATQRSVILDLRRAAYPAALDSKNDEAQMRAHASIFKGLEQEAKLVGAYAPMRTVGAPTDTEFGERFLHLVSLIRPDTLKELTRGYISSNPAIASHHGGHDQPVDAEVVALPTPVHVDPGVAPEAAGRPVASDGDGQASAGVDAAPARPPAADDGDDWANT